MTGLIGEEDIQRVREATDIVALVSQYTPLKQKGRDFWCCCPFHNEKTPSCKVDPSLQLWHCFGCGEGGDVFDFIMKLTGLSFPEAVEQLAEQAHIEITPSASYSHKLSSSEKGRLREICKLTAEFYHFQLMRSKAPEAVKARVYMSGRNLGGPVPNEWMLGFAPGRKTLVHHLQAKGYNAEDLIKANVAQNNQTRGLQDRFFNRIMFPIKDENGNVIAFGGRVIGDGEPKYLNTGETPLFHKSNVLYGLDKAKTAVTSSGEVVVVEGYTDVIALSEAGIENVCATLGTALTTKHIRLLSRLASKRIVYLFDGDAAGQRAADRALQFIDISMMPEAGSTRIDLFAVTLPDNLDPAEYIAERGLDSLRELIRKATPLLRYGIDRRLEQYDLRSPEGRSRALKDATGILAPIKSSFIAKDYARYIASCVSAREEEVLACLNELKVPKLPSERTSTEASYVQTGNRQKLPLASTEAYTRAAYPESSPLERRPTFQNGEPSTAQNAPRSGSFSSLPLNEQNRIRFERELFNLCVRNPALAIAKADAVLSIQYHSKVHVQLIESTYEILEQQPNIEVSRLSSELISRFPWAVSILACETSYKENLLFPGFNYLLEELEIGDLEDNLATCKRELHDLRSNSETRDSEEADALFQSIAILQKTISERKRHHKPPMEK